MCRDHAIVNLSLCSTSRRYTILARIVSLLVIRLTPTCSRLRSSAPASHSQPPTSAHTV